jgi:glycine cleavage system H protein
VNPDDLLYAETHEWVRLEETDGEKFVVVGITAFAVEQLVDVTYLEMRPVGTLASAGEEIGNNLQLLSDDPYQAGWMAKIRVAEEAAIGKLMDRTAYEAQCAEEG